MEIRHNAELSLLKAMNRSITRFLILLVITVPVKFFYDNCLLNA